MLKLKKIKAEDRNRCEMPKPVSSHPSLYLNNVQVPEIKDWEVLEEYEMIIRVKQRSRGEQGDGSVDGSFDVVAYKVIDKKKIEDMTDEEFAEYQGKSLEAGELQ